jgi:hypothetical protein
MQIIYIVKNAPGGIFSCAEKLDELVQSQI